MRNGLRYLPMMVLFLAVIVATGVAQESKPRVAVIRIWHGGSVPNSHDLTADFASQLAEKMAESDRVEVIPMNRVLEAIDEVGFEPDDLLDVDEALEVGQELGATHVIVGAALVSLQGTRTDARIYNVEAEQILATATADGTGTDNMTMLATLANRLLAQFDEPPGSWKTVTDFQWSQEFKIVASSSVERISHPQLIASLPNPPFELSYDQEMERFIGAGNKASSFVLYVDDESLVTITPDHYPPKEYRSHSYELGGVEYEFNILLKDIKINRQSTSRRGDTAIQWLIDATILIEVHPAED